LLGESSQYLRATIGTDPDKAGLACALPGDWRSGLMLRKERCAWPARFCGWTPRKIDTGPEEISGRLQRTFDRTGPTGSSAAARCSVAVARQANRHTLASAATKPGALRSSATRRGVARSGCCGPHWFSTAVGHWGSNSSVDEATPHSKLLAALDYAGV